MTLLAALPPGELRRLRGPALLRSSRPRASNPLFEPTAPMRILLAPDLSPADATAQNLVNLAEHEGVEVHAHPTVAEKFGSVHIRRFELMKRDHGFTVRWRNGSRTAESLVLIAERADSLAIGLLREVPPPNEMEAWAATVTWAWSHDSPIQLTATRHSQAVWERTTTSGFADRGFMSPEEALAAVLAVLHHHNRYIVVAGPGYLHRCDTFGWYSGAAQIATPWYRSIFTAVVEERETTADPSAPSPDLLLDCLQGIFVRIRQLLRIHDRLAWLSLVEASEGANNGAVDEQADLVFDAVSAVNGVLDGLVVWLVEREGIQAGAEKKSVGFPALHAKGKSKKWVAQFARHAGAIALLQRPPHPILRLASEMRLKGYHYHPLLTTVLQFPELVQVTDADGSDRWAAVREETAGAVRVGQPLAGDLGLPYGVDGFVVLEDDAFALPLGFVRGLLREFLRLLNEVLEQVAKAEGLRLDTDNEYFGRASPYAAAAVDFDRQLAIAHADLFGE